MCKFSLKSVKQNLRYDISLTNYRMSLVKVISVILFLENEII